MHLRVGEGGWLGARAGVERSGAMGRWRWVVGCGGGLHGRRMGFKAKGEGLSAGGSERRPCVGSEGSEGMCGIRGIRGIRGHHAGSGGAARGPGRWAMRGLSTGGLGAKGLFRSRPEIPKEPVQSSASSSHVFLTRPRIPKESVQSPLALFPCGGTASFLRCSHCLALFPALAP